MADFNTYWPKLQQWEGGYQNNSADPGNYNSEGDLVGTNFGISAKAFEIFLGSPPSVADMQSMTIATAKSIYVDQYWNTIRGSDIESQALAEILVDAYINTGSNGTRLMQQVLNAAGSDLTVDGVIGPLSIAEINDSNVVVVHDTFKLARKTYYSDLVNANESMAVFLQGWINRVNSFPCLSINCESAIDLGVDDVYLASKKKQLAGRGKLRSA